AGEARGMLRRILSAWKLVTAMGIALLLLHGARPEHASSQMWFVRGVVRADELELLARLVAAEAEGEPYAGQVAVAAVVLNRVDSPQFPNSISGVAYQPLAFESVSNGLIWRRQPSAQAYNAARDALNGWDPSYGSLFFWNPSKPVSPWIWTRTIVVRIGSHVFGR
ncbi:MAG: cell wall hydrolase, partial [Limnochordales bacterium]